MFQLSGSTSDLKATDEESSVKVDLLGEQTPGSGPIHSHICRGLSLGRTLFDAPSPTSSFFEASVHREYGISDTSLRWKPSLSDL